jgi:hypothetical protein
MQVIWALDAATQTWQFYDPALPDASDLANLTVGQGYFIEVSENCVLTYGTKTYQLYAGWNNIGWLGA